MNEDRKAVIDNFKRPRFPFIAFLARKRISKDGITSPKLKPFVLDISRHHADPLRVAQYLAKGWAVFDYRLPSEQEIKRLKDKFAGSYDFGDTDIYRELQGALEMATGASDQRVQEVESERDLLKKRVEELERLTASKTAKPVVKEQDGKRSALS
jgi:hypothetical protein